MKEEHKFMGVKDVCEYLGIDRGTFWRICNLRGFPQKIEFQSNDDSKWKNENNLPFFRYEEVKLWKYNLDSYIQSKKERRKC